jgi:acyl transferase domain-containing protein
LEEALPEEWTAGQDLEGEVVPDGESASDAAARVGGDPPIESTRTTDGQAEPLRVLSAGTAMPWVLSGRDAGGVRGQAQRLLARLHDGDLVDGDVGLSLGYRPLFDHRAVVVGRDRRRLASGVEGIARGELVAGAVEGVAAQSLERIAFVFPGQGGQWEGMATGLLDESPLFAALMRECGEALARYVGWSVEDVLRGADGAPGLDRVDAVQPVLFAVMVALAQLWRACGVEPAGVVGHSQGEIAAAYVAGALTLDDASRVVAARSRALTDLAGKGGMASVALGVSEVLPRIEPLGERVAVAAVNGPSSVVVSGEPRALEELVAECDSEGIRARLIPVNYAAHTLQVESIREELLAECAAIEPRSSDIPFYSAVAGGLLDTAELGADYWFRNLRQPVLFEGATRALLDDGFRAFVEVSPHRC